MDPRSQRLLLVLLLFVLTLGLYRDFGDHVRVARLTQHAASFAVQKPLDEVSQLQSFEDVALKLANSTLGVSITIHSTCKSTDNQTFDFPLLLQIPSIISYFNPHLSPKIDMSY